MPRRFCLVADALRRTNRNQTVLKQADKIEKAFFRAMQIYAAAGFKALDLAGPNWRKALEALRSAKEKTGFFALVRGLPAEARR